MIYEIYTPVQRFASLRIIFVYFLKFICFYSTLHNVHFLQKFPDKRDFSYISGVFVFVESIS